MPPKKFLIEGAVTPAEAARFAAIADEVITSPKYRMAGRTARKTDGDTPHIGTLREKRLHAAISSICVPMRPATNVPWRICWRRMIPWTDREPP